MIDYNYAVVMQHANIVYLPANVSNFRHELLTIDCHFIEILMGSRPNHQKTVSTRVFQEVLVSQMPMTLVKAREHNVQQCINDCFDCHFVCKETVVYSLELGKEHAEASHIRQLYACAEICATMANFATLAAHGTSKLAGACGDICEITAQSCDKFSTDRPMLSCAEACRKCAESCKIVSGMNVF